MPHPFSTVGPITTHTYTLLLAAGILIAIAMTTIRYRLRYAVPAGAVVDVCIAGLVGGVLLARVFHVALNWTYFNLHRDEIRFITAGGLDWHGAVIGALAGMFVMARMRRVSLPALLNTMALAVPFIGFMAWWGCGANHCAYGAEVDNLSNYPPWLVWERNDLYNIILPRYATQPLGMMFSAGVFVLALGLGRLSHLTSPLYPTPRLGDSACDKGAFVPPTTSYHSPSLSTGRGAGGGVNSFWLILAIYALGMVAIGFLRGDYAAMLAGLRLDQWLDLGMVVLAFMGDLVLRRSRRRRLTSAQDYTAARPHHQYH